MKKFGQFIKRHWYVPFFILAMILGWVLFRKKSNPVKRTRIELQAIEAGRQAQELQERLGNEAAKKHLDLQYREERAALDEKQAAKAKELANDPVALSKFLVRAGSGN